MNLPEMQETQVRSLDQEDNPEKGMTTHSSILAWKIPWTEEPGRLQSMGSQRVRHNWATNTPLSHWGPSLGEMAPYAESSSILCPGESAPFFSTDIPQKLELTNTNTWNQSVKQLFLSPFLVFLFFKCQWMWHHCWHHWEKLWFLLPSSHKPDSSWNFESGPTKTAYLPLQAENLGTSIYYNGL